MIKLMISAMTISMLFASPIHAAEIKANSTIKAVTIYPDSAKIMRVSMIKLQAGANDIVISNLPVNLNETSLRVSGEGQGEISLGSVELLRNIQQDIVQEREKSILDQIEGLQDKHRKTQDALLRHRNQFDYIKRMVFGSEKNSNDKNSETEHDTYRNLPIEKWQEAWETLDTATATIQERTRIAEKSLQSYNKQITTLKKELNQIAVNQRETRSVKLQVNSGSATNLTLKLTYQIHGARWTPVYDADLNTTTGKVELKTLAQISQRTGEDWTNVNVTLSTLRPSAGTQLPQLAPWVLDFMPDIPRPEPMLEQDFRMEKGNNMVREMVGAEASKATTAASMVKRKMAQQQSQLMTSDFSAEYKVPSLISLDSGSNKRRFALTSQSYDADVHLASAPRYDPRAMILAKTKHTGDTPLLAGSLSLYRDGSFVGTTFMQQKLSGEELKLSFGEDDKVKITFTPSPDKRRKAGLLFGKNKVVERHYQLSIHSNHNKAFEISLYDVLPVAANEDIKVKLLGEAPSKKDLDDKKGVVSWERTLKPKQSIKLKYGYTVSYPEDKIIPSLARTPR